MSLISHILKTPTIPAKSWNALRAEHQRNRPLRGTNVTLRWTADGVLVSISIGSTFVHPWTIDASWVWDKTIQPELGKWVASVTPGFVDGKEVTLSVQQKDGSSKDVPLTDLPAPTVDLTFRDPTTSAGFSTDGDGNLITLPGEGYPPFFATIGVEPPDPGSVTTKNPDDDPGRDRQILACDIALIMPRVTTVQDLTVEDAQTDSQNISISTTINVPTITTRARLDAVPKWTPPMEPTAEDLLMGDAVQPSTDEILIGTLFLVSPPKFNGDFPDASWTPYPQNFVFWNLNHASAAIPPSAPPDPITFPLAGVLADGITDGLINSLLSADNDESDQINAYLNAGNFAGKYWST